MRSRHELKLYLKLIISCESVRDRSTCSLFLHLFMQYCRFSSLAATEVMQNLQVVKTSQLW